MYLFHPATDNCFDTDNKKDMHDILAEITEQNSDLFFDWWAADEHIDPWQMYAEFTSLVADGDFDAVAAKRQRFYQYVINNPEKYGFVKITEGVDD